MPDEIQDETPEADATPEPTSTPTEDTEDAPLGPAGEKALNEWKARAKAAEADAKKAREYETELTKLREAQMSEQEKAVEAARNEGRTEAATLANARLFRAELKAAAKGKLANPDLLADPDVALKLLDLGEYPITATGDIDAEAISAAVDSFIEREPYLAASATQRPGPIEQGARADTTAVKSIDDQIAEAEASGDFKTSGRLKTQKMLAAPRG